MLEPWFAAVRDEPAEPPLSLLSAILADAGAVDDARQAEEHMAPEAAPDRDANSGPKPTGVTAVASPEAARVPPQAGEAGRFNLVRAGKALAALAACAALGFWIGLAGQVTIEDGTVWSGPQSAAAESVPEDPVGAFFDLASVEG